jgi:hypothetical protein
MSEIPATPVAATGKRDVLGHVCFLLHLIVMVFIALGWTLPEPGALVVYLVVLPAVVAQWQFNKNSCVLNNVESLLRTGSWRDPANSEEGAWLAGVARSLLGLDLNPARLDVFVYFLLAVFWMLGLSHLLRG